MGELSMYRQAGTKPNSGEVERRCGTGRHTVARYWREDKDVEDLRRSKPSAFDQVKKVIEEKSTMPGITKGAVYEYLLDRRPDLSLPKYGAFTQYCRRRGIAFSGACGTGPHPRFETPPGRQM